MDNVLTCRAITLVEAKTVRSDTRQELIQTIMPHTGSSIRIGVSGPPELENQHFRCLECH